MKFYWCSWEAPDDIPNEDIAEAWPDNMIGFCSGSGDGYWTFVASVLAENEEEVWETVLSCYPKHRDRIRERIEPDARAVPGRDWDRFPGLGEWERQKMEEIADERL